MTKTRVLFDTSALLDIHPSSAQAERLRGLCAEGLCEVYVPAIVVDELKSQVSERLRPSGEPLSALGWLADKKYQRIVRALDYLKKLDKTSAASRSVDEWLRNLGAVIVSYASAEDVFKSYFEGSGTFRKPKARDDIPDGFVFAAIKSLAAKHPVHAVCRDEALGKAMKSLPNVANVHVQLRDFLAIDDFEPPLPLLESTSIIASNGELIVDLVADDIVSAVVGQDVFMDRMHTFFLGRVRALRNLELNSVDATDTLPINEHIISVFFACTGEADLVRDPSVSSLVATESTHRLGLEVTAEVRLRAKSGRILEVAGASLAGVQWSHDVRLKYFKRERCALGCRRTPGSSMKMSCAGCCSTRNMSPSKSRSPSPHCSSPRSPPRPVSKMLTVH